MIVKALLSLVSASCLASFRTALPAPALPTVSVGGGQAAAAGLLRGPAPLVLAPTAAPLPRAAVLPAAAAPASPAAVSVHGAAVAETAQAAVLPEPARAAAPALVGRGEWTQLFDGTRGAARNGVLDARPAPLTESWEETYRLHAQVAALQQELSAIHGAERAGEPGLAARKRSLWVKLKAADEGLNGPLEGDFQRASERLRAARAERGTARNALNAALRERARTEAVASASAEVRRAEAAAVGAGLRTARLLLEGAAKVHSKEGRRNAALATLSGAASAALALHTEVAFGEARTLGAGSAAPVTVPVRRWRNAAAVLAPGAPAEKVLVPATAVYPDRPTAVRAQEHQLEAMAAEAQVLDRRSAEVSFWVELLQDAGAEGAAHRPLAPAEDAAFASFLADSLAWAGRGVVPAKREAGRSLAQAAEAAAQGSFAAAAARLEAARSALDERAEELARMRSAVERRAARLSASGRHEALLEAAARWRRLLRKPLDAARAADLAGEARNHREAYLAEDEPGLPGYRRAAKDLERLEAALTALSRADARALVDRFEQDLVHRRSLRLDVVLRQDRDGGTVRRTERFALPGTTLKTLLKRVGGIPERPEVRVNGGAWTPYAGLDLRGKLADETLVEILLPPAGR